MGSVDISLQAFFLAKRSSNPGFPLCFGVFQAHYSTLPQFKDSPYIAVVGTIASGMSYLAAPIIIPFIKRYSKYRYLMIWIGCKSYIPVLLRPSLH
jgi:hypothetical protein